MSGAMAFAALRRLARPGRRMRWLWGIGVGFPLLMGLVIALIVLMAWITGGYEPPVEWDAGSLEDFEPGLPAFVETSGADRFWVVRLESGEVLALGDRDPESRCSVSWRPEYEFMGEKGWFRDACRGSTYDITGQCSAGPCVRGMGRLDVRVEEGRVIVALREAP